VAAYTVVKSKVATLIGATVDTVTMSGALPGYHLLVSNTSGTGVISVTIDGSTPTVGGDDAFHVSAGTTIDVAIVSSSSSISVKVIGAGNGYIVQLVP